MEDSIKKIAILSCLNASGVCSGAACFRALNQRSHHFKVYEDQGVEVIGFFHCNGCHCDYDNDKDYLEKIEYVISLKPDAVHVGKCTCMGGKECSVITRIIETLEHSGVKVVRGTH